MGPAGERRVLERFDPAGSGKGRAARAMPPDAGGRYCSAALFEE